MTTVQYSSSSCKETLFKIHRSFRLVDAEQKALGVGGGGGGNKTLHRQGDGIKHHGTSSATSE